MRWMNIRGRDLEIQNDSSESDLNACAAIYAWRRSFDSRVDDAEVVERWIEKLVKTPAGVVDETTLMHSIAVGLKIGGQGLTEDKHEALHDACSDSAFRRELTDFVGSLGDLSVTLYVGRTKNLRRRVKNHLSGSTSVKSYMDRLGLSWEDVRLWYYELPWKESEMNPERERLLGLLELTAQLTLTPLGSQRFG